MTKSIALAYRVGESIAHAVVKETYAAIALSPLEYSKENERREFAERNEEIGIFIEILIFIALYTFYFIYFIF